MAGVTSQPPLVVIDDENPTPETELRTILNAVKQKNIVIGLLLEFMALTGLRYSDASNLKRKDIFINGGVIKKSINVVQQKIYSKLKTLGTKDAKKRATVTVVISDRCKGILQEVADITEGCEYLFESDKWVKQVKPYSIQYTNMLLKKIATNLQLDFPLSTHSFRKAYALLLIENGAQIHQVRDCLGQASLSSTDHYLSTCTRDKERLVKKLVF